MKDYIWVVEWKREDGQWQFEEHFFSRESARSYIANQRVWGGGDKYRAVKYVREWL